MDNVLNLRDDKVYLFSGSLDTVVAQSVVQELQKYYSNFLPAANIVAEYHRTVSITIWFCLEYVCMYVRKMYVCMYVCMHVYVCIQYVCT